MKKKTFANFNEQKEFFLKWTQYLFYIQVGALVFSIVGELPILDNLVMWVNKLFAIASLYVFYQMSNVHPRYKKAAIFCGVALVLSLLVVFMRTSTLIVLAIGICNLLFTYNEYSGHSDILDDVDKKLSRNWHSLFNWEIIVGVLMGVVSSVLVVVGVLMNVETDIITNLSIGALDIVALILDVVYVYFLYRMRILYAAYEPILVETDCAIDEIVE